jgi:hypothetical protein
MLRHFVYSTNKRKTENRIETMNSSRQPNDECEGGTSGMKEIEGKL